jgi:hypothetical protein
MNFGEKFSKVEYLLSESYVNETFSEDIKKFQTLVLENKTLSQIYFLYSELSKEQGFDKSFAEDYLNESVSQIKELSKIVKTSGFDKWVSSVVCENKYLKIDELVNNDPLKLKEKVLAKSQVVESLTKKSIQKESLRIPLSSVEVIRRNVIKNYIGSLDETTQRNLKDILGKNDDDLKDLFEDYKTKTLDKLNSLVTENHDELTKNKINETISFVKKEDYNKFNYVKLKNLFEGLV